MEWSEFLGVGSDLVSHKLTFFQAYLKISCPSFFSFSLSLSSEEKDEIILSGDSLWVSGF